MTYPAQKVAGEQVTADDFNDYTLNPAYTYGETLAPGEAVYLKNSDGKIWKASAATQAHVDAFVGIALVSGVANDENPILAPGKVVQGLSGLTAGSNVYLSDTAGALSTTPGTIPLVVGLAIATTSMLVNKSTERAGVNLFGDASDGDVTISSTVTLTRDMFYNTLTLANSGILETGGYRIYAKTIYRPAASNGYIRNNGGNGGNGTNSPAASVGGNAGAAGAAAPGVTVPASLPGVIGIAGYGTNSSSTNGQAGNNGTAQSPSFSATNGSNGGKGGDTSSPGVQTGGAAGAGGASTQTKEVPRSYDLATKLYEISGGSTITFPKPSGGAASGGTGAAAVSISQNISAGGSGGGGGGGGVVWVAARIINDQSTGNMFVAVGGNGGSGGSGAASGAGNVCVAGSGGGAGGNGGLVIRITRFIVGTATVNVSGGTGGTGGVAITYGSGGGQAGANGVNGGSGLSIDIQL